MEQKQATAIIISTLMAFSLMLGGNQLRAQSEAADSGPINLTVSLAGSPTVSLGEPILLKYAINNTGGQKANVFTEDSKQNSLITERFTDTAGKTLVPSVNPIPPYRSPNTLFIFDGPNLEGMNADTSRSWETVANAYVTFPHPGRYVLRVHVQNPVVFGDDDQAPRHLLSGDHVFPLTVVQANPTALRDTAERLRQSVLSTTDLNARATLIKALFSMPEASASTSWQTLVEEPRLDGYALNQIGTALARIHTARAADILMEMVWEPVQTPLACAEAMSGQHLDAMYDTGDAELKKHIEGLRAKHGLEASHFHVE